MVFRLGRKTVRTLLREGTITGTFKKNSTPIEIVKCGLEAFFLHNSTAAIVMDWLLYFLRTIGKKLTIFCVGHGAHMIDLNDDQSDGFDEAMVFDDGHILDNDLPEVLVQNATEKARSALLSDCCHSGSVKDLQSKRLNGQKKGNHSR
jgi:hypothetical protein